MSTIDLGLLNATEWCCRKFQVLTGRTNVWLAVQLTNLSIVVYFVWAGVYFWRADVTERVVIAAFCFGVLYVLMQTVFKVPIEASESAAYTRVSKGLRNPRRIRDAQLRIAFLTLSLLLAYPIYFLFSVLRHEFLLLTYSLIVLTMVLLYVLACDPLPPTTGKLVESLKGLMVLRPAASEAAARKPRV